LSVIASLLFIALLYAASHFSHLIIFILAMAIWGIYYELLNFARQQFIADSVPLRLHTGASAVLSSFKSLAYFLGPILAGLLIFKGTLALSSTTLLLTLIGALLLTFTLRHHHRPMSIDVHHVNFLSELQHWQTLLKHVWPIVTLSLLVGIIDATFWTTGTVLTQQLSKHHLLGGLFLPLYTLPSLLVGFGLARLHLFQGKKKIALICTLLSGLSLTFIGITHHLALILIAVFISGILLAVSYPLIDAVYADIVSRMGRNRQHLIGLSSSSMSLAYIIGPILSGAIASLLGESTTFSIIGIITMIISATLLLLTPKKLKLPQTQISTWA
jgi:MFS family permease